ncbi:hypothetical protein GCM10010995_08100 [Cysteiniphilum litorale]|uniref:Uncharacterized protein n=2 Tax=Fastidiosibacteraceae TaxID=2056687 RepID=A0A8J2Z3B8_9GAMM|nr:hypothetical protein GCM10010995_08100 [Cysteiniphilum litorale]
MTNEDWDGDSRPDHNLDNSIITANTTICQREEINTYVQNHRQIAFALYINGQRSDFSLANIPNVCIGKSCTTNTGYFWTVTDNSALIGERSSNINWEIKPNYSSGFECSNGKSCALFKVSSQVPNQPSPSPPQDKKYNLQFKNISTSSVNIPTFKIGINQTTLIIPQSQNLLISQQNDDVFKKYINMEGGDDLVSTILSAPSMQGCSAIPDPLMSGGLNAYSCPMQIGQSQMQLIVSNTNEANIFLGIKLGVFDTKYNIKHTLFWSDYPQECFIINFDKIDIPTTDNIDLTKDITFNFINNANKCNEFKKEGWQAYQY